VDALIRGVVDTLLVTLSCSVAGFALGLLIACARRLEPRGLVAVLAIYTYVFRAVPVLVLLFIVFFGLPPLGLQVPPLLAMVLSLGVVASAYLAEVFRGAFQAIDSDEILAAQATGLNRLQTLIHIELPQMLRFAVPGMVNEFTTILKYSPFASMVGIAEITRQAMNLTATTLRGLEIYLAVGLLYFAIYRVLLVGIHWVERRFRVPGLSPEPGRL
jgi:polar amino acid transport system permease protein